LILVVTDCVTTTSVRRLSAEWTKFVHPTSVTGHLDQLPSIHIFGAGQNDPHQIATASQGKVVL